MCSERISRAIAQTQLSPDSDFLRKQAQNQIKNSLGAASKLQNQKGARLNGSKLGQRGAASEGLPVRRAACTAAPPGGLKEPGT